MSMDPDTMSQMLTQQLLQPPATASYGGGQAGPQMQSQMTLPNAAAAITQKLLLMKALQNRQQAQQTQAANAMLPGTNAQIANDPQINAMVNGSMDPSVLAQLQQQQPAQISPVAPVAPTPSN